MQCRGHDRFRVWQGLYVYNWTYCICKADITSMFKSMRLVINYFVISFITTVTIQLLFLSSIPGSKLIFYTDPFLHSSSNFPSTRLTPWTPAVFRLSRACRFKLWHCVLSWLLVTLHYMHITCKSLHIITQNYNNNNDNSLKL